MLKKKITALLIAASMILGGCSTSRETVVNSKDSTVVEETSILKKVEQGFNYCIFRDTETGVMYIRCAEQGVIPMFNADGSLKIYGEYRGKQNEEY